MAEIKVGYLQQLPTALQVTFADRFDVMTGETLAQWRSTREVQQWIGSSTEPNSYELVSPAEAPLVPTVPPEDPPLDEAEAAVAETAQVAAAALTAYLAIPTPTASDRTVRDAALTDLRFAQQLLAVRYRLSGGAPAEVIDAAETVEAAIVVYLEIANPTDVDRAVVESALARLQLCEELAAVNELT